MNFPHPVGEFFFCCCFPNNWESEFKTFQNIIKANDVITFKTVEKDIGSNMPIFQAESGLI